MQERGLVIMADINLNARINQVLGKYEVTVNDKVKELVDETTKEAVKELKNTSPTRTGVYRKSWSSTNIKTGARSKANKIHNKKKSRLTHLLEKSHVGRDGKRVRAIPHILPVEARAVRKFEEKVEDIINNG